MKPEEIIEIGYRIQTLRQMFNAREGAIRNEIPPRLLGDPPLKKGPVAGVTLDAEAMIQGYFEGMGFEENGVPTEIILKVLKLDFCLDDLPNCIGRLGPIQNSYLQQKTNKNVESPLPTSSSGPQKNLCKLGRLF